MSCRSGSRSASIGFWEHAEIKPISPIANAIRTMPVRDGQIEFVFRSLFCKRVYCRFEWFRPSTTSLRSKKGISKFPGRNLPTKGRRLDSRTDRPTTSEAAVANLGRFVASRSTPPSQALGNHFQSQRRARRQRLPAETVRKVLAPFAQLVQESKRRFAELGNGILNRNRGGIHHLPFDQALIF